MGEDRFGVERATLLDGCRVIAGLDEAGRGPLAGPVVAAAVILPIEWIESGLPSELEGLNDSKQLSLSQRERFFDVLMKESGVCHGIGISESSAIDRSNILRATHQAMNVSLETIQPEPDHVLVDGRPVKSLKFPHTAIVKGDTRSYSIAAASIIAKVTRDRLMVDHHQRWPQYGFAEHKGYGTPQHLAAIAKHGPCPIHRMTFAPLKPQEQGLF